MRKTIKEPKPTWPGNAALEWNPCVNYGEKKGSSIVLKAKGDPTAWGRITVWFDDKMDVIYHLDWYRKTCDCGSFIGSALGDTKDLRLAKTTVQDALLNYYGPNPKMLDDLPKGITK